MFTFVAKMLASSQGTFDRRRLFRRHLLRRATRLAYFALVALLSPTVYESSLRAESSNRPNIIYILADDMGYSDLECYGSEIKTPHLNRLAEGGLRFTQFYNTGRCCPTRASLLTGLYPHQAGIGHMMDDRGNDGYRGQLSKHAVTIAEVLKPAGYKSYAVGKWHVTSTIDPKSLADKHNWPLQRGFDRFYGTIHGAGSFYDPNTLTRDNDFVSPFADPQYVTDDYYYTDAISDHAVRFVTEHHATNVGEPFFMYVTYTAAHWPMHARESDIAKYAGKYDAGYQNIRDARYEKMLKLGVVDASSTVNFPIPEKYKETEFLDWDQRNMEVYAAMIDSMDQGIGKLIASLESTGQLDNTLICFLQDNGGCQEEMGRGKRGTPRADQPSLAPLANDYLQPQMIPRQTRDGFPMRQGKGVMAGGADTYIGYGYGWATVSNTPFRMFKHYVHEGGISTPLIAHWPAQIKRHGELESTPGHLIDLMATAVDVANADYPKSNGNGSIIPMEGLSLTPVFGGAPIDRQALYWEHEGNRAIRVGDYKLVSMYPGDWELYNISVDRSEQHDLSRAEPARFEQLGTMWHSYAERALVQPWKQSGSFDDHVQKTKN